MPRRRESRRNDGQAQPIPGRDPARQVPLDGCSAACGAARTGDHGNSSRRISVSIKSSPVGDLRRCSRKVRTTSGRAIDA